MHQSGAEVNLVTEQLYQCGFVDTLEQMTFPNEALYQKADEFVVKHFGYEEEEENLNFPQMN